ncbi:hypothetical protein D3C85_1093410 [compost metagenome]
MDTSCWLMPSCNSRDTRERSSSCRWTMRWLRAESLRSAKRCSVKFSISPPVNTTSTAISEKEAIASTVVSTPDATSWRDLRVATSTSSI